MDLNKSYTTDQTVFYNLHFLFVQQIFRCKETKMAWCADTKKLITA